MCKEAPTSAKGLCNRCYLRRDQKLRRRPNIGVTRSNLLQEVAEISDLTFPQARTVLHAIEHTITQALKRGEKVKIPGFGTFIPRIRPPKFFNIGRKVFPAKPYIYFKPSPIFIHLLNPHIPPRIPSKKTSHAHPRT